MKIFAENYAVAMRRFRNAGKYLFGKPPMYRTWLVVLPSAVVLSAIHYAIEFLILNGGESWEPLQRWISLNLVLLAGLLWIAWVYSRSLKGMAAVIASALIIFALFVYVFVLQFFWGWGLVRI